MLSATAQPAAAEIGAGPYDGRPDAVGAIRHGMAVGGIAKDPGVPEGRPKSALAPIRRPPYSAEARRRRSAPKAAFFGIVQSRSRWRLRRLQMRHIPCGYGPFSFPQGGKENGGISTLDRPLAGARLPWPTFGGPHFPRRPRAAPLRLLKWSQRLQNAQCLRRAAALPPEAPAVPLTPPSIPFPSWPAGHPASCSCRPSASAGPSPPASDHPR